MLLRNDTYYTYQPSTNTYEGNKLGKEHTTENTTQPHLQLQWLQATMSQKKFARAPPYFWWGVRELGYRG